MMHAKRSLLSLLCGCLALAHGARADEATAVTQPVGVVTLDAPGGSSSALSLPLEPSPAFVGEVATVRKRVITWEGEGWSGRTRASYRRNPWFVRMTDGRSAGQSFLILSGSSNRARLAAAEDLRISPGDHFEILPADTLATTFGADVLPGADPALADNVLLLEDGDWKTYFNDGAHWRLQGDARGLSRDATVIAPGQGFLLIRRSPGALSLRITGDVPDGAVRPPHRATRALVGSPFPTSRPLGALGLQQSWGSASLLEAGAWQRYFPRGKAWVDAKGRDSRPQLGVGAAVLVE